MSKIQTKKVAFFMIPIPKFILKKCLSPRYGISNLKQFHWLTHDDMEFQLDLKGPFWVEISSNGPRLRSYVFLCFV